MIRSVRVKKTETMTGKQVMSEVQAFIVTHEPGPLMGGEGGDDKPDFTEELLIQLKQVAQSLAE